MVTKVNQACAALLVDLLVNETTGEVPWYLVHLYLYLTDKDIYSVCGPTYRKFTYCHNRAEFIISMYKETAEKGVSEQYDEIVSRAFYNRGEYYFTSLLGAKGAEKDKRTA